MDSKDEEYKELFLAEAQDNIEEVNRLLIIMERSRDDKETVNALFRITHTLKGNAAGMGFKAVAEMAHVLEDLFGEVREGKIKFSDDIFQIIYKGVDVLSSLVNSIRDGKNIAYKGIKTKIEVVINRANAQIENSTNNQSNGEINNGEKKAELFDSDNLVNDTSEEWNTENDLERDSKVTFSDLVQVPVRKLDNLLNLVGELIIEKDRILASKSVLNSTNEYSRLTRISSDLQYSVMDVRLVQVGFLFNKFHRVIRDAAMVEKKNVVLKLEGTETEIDRNVLQVISDSLIHLIRNAVGHGIEEPEKRKELSKPKDGTVWLSARSESDVVVIEIRDDGNGINHGRVLKKAIEKGLITSEDAARLPIESINMLIFEPGFSTMDQVTAISGRGVGMDVVKQTLDSIGGTIEVESEIGKGTTIRLTLPSSMAVKSSLLFELSDEVFAIPLSYTESVISLGKRDIHKVGGGLVATHLKKNIAIFFLKDIFNYNSAEFKISGNTLQQSFDKIDENEKLEILVVSYNNRVAGFVVDRLLQQKEIVEKPLMKPVDKVKFISGVTILGSGNVCLVLNVVSLLQSVLSTNSSNKISKNIVLN